MKIFLLLFLFSTFVSFAEEPQYPLIGAQVFIEPGQTQQDIDHWFKVLEESGMTICRIRMFESYMKNESGNWDFTLFDTAFKAAERHGIKVYGTFFPETTKTDIGGWKAPKDEEQLAKFAEFIKQVTVHFKQYKSLYAWVLVNEIGGGYQDNSFTRKLRAEWSKTNPTIDRNDKGYPVLVDLLDGKFRAYENTWMLNWLANEVRKYDQKVHLHENCHAIFSLVDEYNFTEWRPFLSSFGGSAHASWHFGFFDRQQYTLAMSANSEMIYSGAGRLPWIMTEISGGNTTYSGNIPLCPTSEEITQWLWTILATEGKGGIFWTLNPRASGIESGEWAMLDFQHQPTDRIRAASEVISCAKKNSILLSKSKKYNSGINILYIRESLFAEEQLNKDGKKLPPKEAGSIMKDMLGYFEVLSQSGVTPNFKAIEEYDFSQDNFENQTIILANQIAIPQKYVESLTRFVSNGGRLIVDGLTGFYDENMHNVMLTGFPFKELFGGEIAEFKYNDALFSYSISDQKVTLPGYGWIGRIKSSTSSSTLSTNNTEVTAIRNQFGKGEVVWIPTLIGYGARLFGYKPLAKFLYKECELDKQPFLFDKFQTLVSMKTLQTQNGFITVVFNKSKQEKKITIKQFSNNFKSQILFANKKGSCNGNNLKIAPEETVVINWNK
jgi:beta-galactosidase